MSGGHLVVTDRAGRDSKRYSLPSGLVTVGSDSTCDIRMMLPAVSAHHATVVVRANQAVIRNVSDGETFVNGQPVSVAALNHGDIITLGDRSFRWEYAHPEAVKPVPAQPAIYVKPSRGGRGRKRASAGAARRVDPALQLALEMRHRSSMPGKQVAVVQPQRRDTHDNVDTNPRLVVKPHRPYVPAAKRQAGRAAASQQDDKHEHKHRKSTPRATPNKLEQTKASMWIESRKSSPRTKSVSPKKSHKIETPKASPTVTPKKTPRKVVTPKADTPKVETPKSVATPKMATLKTVTPKNTPRKSVTPKIVVNKATPLRTLVLRKAVTPNPRAAPPPALRLTQSAAKVAKIQAPLKIDHTKQAALMLMARHTPKGPSLLVKKTSPITPKPAPTGLTSPKSTPRNRQSSGRKSKSTPRINKSVGRNSTLIEIDTPQNKSISFVDVNASINKSGRRSKASLMEVDTPTDVSSRRSTLSYVDANSSQRKSGKNSAPLVDLDTPQSRRSTANFVDATLTSPTNKSGRRSTASFVDANSSSNKSIGSRSTVSLVDLDTPQNISQSKKSRGSNSTASLVDLDTPQTNKSLRKSTDASQSNISRGRRSTVSIVDVDETQTSRSSGRRSTVSVMDVDSPNASVGRQSRSSGANVSQISRRSASEGSVGRKSKVSLKRGSASVSRKRSSSRYSGGDSVSPSVLPPAPSPKKSSMKNPLSKSTRKTESIKFDLSNLENSEDESTDVFSVSNVTKKSVRSDKTGGDPTLQFSDTTQFESPSPRRSVQSRSSKILQKTLGSTLVDTFEASTLTPQSPKSRKSIRGSLIVAKALSTPEKSTYSTRTTKSVSDSVTTSPRSPKRKLESYSIVDLVNDSKSSEYGSIASTSTAFGTPQNSRKTRSIINPTLVDSSTPFTKGRESRRTLSQTSDSFVSMKPSPVARRSKSTPQSEKSDKSARQSRASKKNDSDVLIVSTRSASASPRTSNVSSRSVGQKSASKTRTKLSLDISAASSRSNQSANRTQTSETKNQSRRSSRKDVTPTTNDGLHTPENQNSPPEASTPVLNIKSLLDSSNLSNKSPKKSRVSANLKRKTIGARASTHKAKSGTKGRSKSLNLSAAKRILRKLSKDSSNVSDRTDEGAPKPSNDDTITPKSTVKLVQEAVKEKHSTAKKPVSKRSIIDNLNDSDIVKQLFASPVKRKLSQSMTEYTRSQLEERPQRTRRTIAVVGRDADQSLMDNSGRITPEVFVSPLGSPASPSLSAVRRLYRKDTPKNDLSNIKGVKSLLRSPRARKSVKNDLSNVAGVKDIFAKSPRNRLSDVRGVKEVFTTAASPQNDLRRVSGVKSLFQSERKRKQPKDDLTNVSGVKRLFRHIKSPDNDLRNVSGVKKTLAKSPKNDLRDVRGVKRMFANEKSRNGISDVSGIEELFNESYDSHRNEVSATESLFDQLVGRPTIKSTYPKSFNKSAKKTPTKRSAKSLNTSIRQITTDVEDWIEKELQQRFNKSASRKSNSKTPKAINRELQKLQTDTVAGVAPLQTARARTSGETSQTKSASEIYSAHTLPIKKRSFAERSLEKSANGKSVLPIKKRALMHSTPVKGRFDLTANVSELGRVSPIAPDDTIRIQQATSSPKPKTAPKRKTATPAKKAATPEKSQTPKKPATPIPKRNRRVTKPRFGAQEIKAELVKPARGKNTKPKSPKTSLASPKPRTTRGKKEPSLVIAKKSPIMSPQPGKRGRKAKETVKVATPKKGRQAEKTVTPKAVSPKKGRHDAEKAVTPKKDAKKAATPRKGKKVEGKAVTPKKTSPPKRAGKKAEKVPTPKKTKAEKKTVTPKKGRKVTEKAVTPKKSAEKVTSPPKRGGRKAKEATPKASPQKVAQKRTRKGAAKVETPKISPVKARRGRKTQEKPATPNIKVKKASIAIAKPSPQMKPEQKRRGRAAAAAQPQSPEKPKRGRKTANSPKDLPKSPEPKNSRKRKITEIDIPVTAPKRGKTETAKKPEVVKATRGKKTVVTVETIETSRGRQKTSTVEKNEMEITRSQRKGESVVEKTTRAQKSKVQKVTEKASPEKRGKKNQSLAAPPARGRKRKSEEPSPKKAPAKKSKSSVKAVKSPSPKKPRSARAKQPVAIAAAAAPRARRR